MYPIKCKSLKVTSKYGNRTYIYRGKKVSGFHHGIDLVGGDEIVCFDDGVIIALCNSGSQYGKMCFVRVKHGNGYQTCYYHLKSGSICVKVGDKVKSGQKLGIIGNTGKSTGVHLHFQIDKGNNKSSINPYDYVFKNKSFDSKTYYIVKRGDSLWSISKKYYGTGSKYKKIVVANNLKNPNKISVGLKLLIP